MFKNLDHQLSLTIAPSWISLLFFPSEWIEVATRVRIFIFNDFHSPWPFLGSPTYFWDLLILFSVSSICQDFQGLSVLFALHFLLLWFGLDLGCWTGAPSLLSGSACQCNNLHVSFAWTAKHWVQMKPYAQVQPKKETPHPALVFVGDGRQGLRRCGVFSNSSFSKKTLRIKGSAEDFCSSFCCVSNLPPHLSVIGNHIHEPYLFSLSGLLPFPFEKPPFPTSSFTLTHIWYFMLPWGSLEIWADSVNLKKRLFTLRD